MRLDDIAREIIGKGRRPVRIETEPHQTGVRVRIFSSAYCPIKKEETDEERFARAIDATPKK
jgi:hypothetical protein